MSIEDESNVGEQSALLLAIGVFLVLFGGVVCLALFYDFSGMNLGGLLFLISFLCCIFISKNFYDLTSQQAQYVERSLPALPDASQSLYTQLYQKSPVPYFVIDGNGIVISGNTAAARLLGIQQQKVIGVDIFSLLTTEDDGRKDFLINKFRSQVAISDEMVKVVREDHREAWGLLSLFQFKNDFSEQQGLLTLVDITKQKKAEDAKSEFVSLASHQLRTPIAGMKWSAELLQLDSPETLTERQVKYMDRLHVSISRMSRLVDDFLRVSRFELGSFHADYQTITLEKLFSDVLAELAETVKHKGVTVQTMFDATITEFVTDPNLLRMVVTNLYSNAVKYTPANGTVTIKYTHDNNMLRIQVADSGMGIPTEDHAGIFSKLFRASNAVRDVPDGTGLGLYIVREAVSVLRGKVSFTSVEGMGTTFDVQIPFEVPN
jgi:PAS domain S-box-containing protein